MAQCQASLCVPYRVMMFFLKCALVRTDVEGTYVECLQRYDVLTEDALYKLIAYMFDAERTMLQNACGLDHRINIWHKKQARLVLSRAC